MAIAFQPAASQDHAQRYLHGIVIDSLTAQPVAQAYVWTKNGGATSDDDGAFYLLIQRGDTIHVSHVSYHNRVIAYNNLGGDLLSILMKQRVRVLKQVNVYPLLSEGDFKQKILETKPSLSREEENAKINAGIMSYLAQYAPAIPMNASDNHAEYMKGPQGVVFFSSKGSKGLIRALKNVIKPKAPSFKKIHDADTTFRATPLR